MGQRAPGNVASLDCDLLAHEVRGRVACLISIACMLAEGKAGALTPEQQEFCDTMGTVGYQLMPFLDELSRRARRSG
ncbi:MAG: hypothetical protein JWM80_2470 [Cyanobacteria bacterium RYN_339]|nr:hypothetical protein [Cyanobacteria bacterium RYN_339]